MTTKTRGHRQHIVPETAWRRLPVQVFLRSGEPGRAPQLRFRLEGGDDLPSVPAESEALRALVEELLRKTSPSGRCSHWFG